MAKVKKSLKELKSCVLEAGKLYRKCDLPISTQLVDYWVKTGKLREVLYGDGAKQRFRAEDVKEAMEAARVQVVMI